MAEDFKYDVFLSHSARDKPAVRELAQQLKANGLHVWFDEWEIHPGDSIPAKIEEGLEYSRVLVLCMSANAFGSDWTQLEAGTFRFRDPLNKERRFIPLRLDDTPIKSSLAQFLYIDWRAKDHEQQYAKLLDACRLGGKPLEAEAFKPIVQMDSDTISTQNHDLQIHISPTRDHQRQLAQIRVLNTGQRPILLDAWLVMWTDNSLSESRCCERGVLPIRLQDHERADLLVDISNHPVEQLEGLGVVDAEHRFWPANAKEIKQFIHVAKLYQPPKINGK